MLSLAAVVSLIAAATAQQIGTETAETHPSLTWSTCTSSGCTEVSGSIVLDANWRWVHEVGTTTNCYTGNEWDASICTTPEVCAEDCAVDGADYEATYGITTSGNALTLGFVTENSNGDNVGSRVYLLNSNTEYETFNLLNHEFTFTVDVSKLPCGLNGAVYFSQMDADGGMARFPTNKAGAEYGTGYCDSQCPQDIKFIDGVANILDWNATNANSGTGSLGTCCNEMDIWEANEYAEAVTPHPCTVTEQTSCTGTECEGTLTTGYCDPAGCDFNPYRMGNTTFFGPGLTIDSTSPVTVITQFITDDGTDTGTLSAIKRYYVQGENAFAQPVATNIGLATNEIDTDFCDAQKTAFGDENIFGTKGGLAQIGENMDAMVLVLSLWDDTSAYMLWLDSDYPVGRSTSDPGTVRGPCATTTGIPATVESEYPSAHVVYSDIKYGTINSTWSGVVGGGQPSTSTTSTKTSTASSSTTSTSGSCSALYGQCAGIGWAGPTCCSSGTCEYNNPYYSQCLE